MQVSFGKIICQKEGKNVTQYQKWIAETIVKKFDINKESPYSYGADKASGVELTLHELLKNKKDVDVVITATKDNAVKVALQKSLYAPDGTKVCSYVVKANSYTPYEELFSAKRMHEPAWDLNNMLKKFVKRCIYFVNH